MNEPAADSAPAPAPTRPRRPALLTATEAALWVLVALLLAWRLAPRVRAALGWGAPAGAAPALALDMLDGRPLALKDLQGQVVLVNFWASWCPPCRAEMPGFQKEYDARRGQGFTVVGISTDEIPRPKVATFLREHGISYPVAMATPEAVAAFGGVASLPTSFLIDRRGRLRYAVHGLFAPAALRAAVDRLLAP
ncbi:MAG TPA: TlpA disulfide reductase family protein [Gemmatimonadales bacterium]|nr:TlpA disulfide reductase family protein [Gemmatimonadales bacterium]